MVCNAHPCGQTPVLAWGLIERIGEISLIEHTVDLREITAVCLVCTPMLIVGVQIGRLSAQRHCPDQTNKYKRKLKSRGQASVHIKQAHQNPLHRSQDRLKITTMNLLRSALLFNLVVLSTSLCYAKPLPQLYEFEEALLGLQALRNAGVEDLRNVGGHQPPPPHPPAAPHVAPPPPAAHDQAARSRYYPSGSTTVRGNKRVQAPDGLERYMYRDQA